MGSGLFQPSQLAYLLFGESCKPLFFTPSLTPFRVSISHVVLHGTEKKMFGVTAKAIIATVQYLKTIGNGTIR